MSHDPFFTRVQADAGPVDPAIVAQASDWLVQLQHNPTDADQLACERWRQRHPHHELAWQRLLAFHQNLQAGAGRVVRPAARQALTTAAQMPARRRAAAWLLGAGGVGVLGLAWRGEWPLRTWTAAYRTGTGEQRTVHLADGTMLMLNTGSAVDVDFTATARVLILRAGEIQVQTGRDAAGRALRVETAQGRVIPVGTRFIVREMGQGDTVLVQVQQGAVAVQPRHALQPVARLAAGQQAVFDARGVSAAVILDEAAAAWADGMLVADRMPLDAFLAELGRYRPGLLRCDPAVAGERVTGAFPLADTDRVLTMLTRVLPVRLSVRTRYWVTVGPA